jgi:hypothetical protein
MSLLLIGAIVVFAYFMNQDTVQRFELRGTHARATVEDLSILQEHITRRNVSNDYFVYVELAAPDGRKIHAGTAEYVTEEQYKTLTAGTPVEIVYLDLINNGDNISVNEILLAASINRVKHDQQGLWLGGAMGGAGLVVIIWTVFGRRKSRTAV